MQNCTEQSLFLRKSGKKSYCTQTSHLKRENNSNCGVDIDRLIAVQTADGEHHNPWYTLWCHIHLQLHQGKPSLVLDQETCPAIDKFLAESILCSPKYRSFVQGCVCVCTLNHVVKPCLKLEGLFRQLFDYFHRIGYCVTKLYNFFFYPTLIQPMQLISK